MAKIECSADGTVTLVELDPSKVYFLIMDFDAIDPSGFRRVTEYFREHGLSNSVIFKKRPGRTIEFVEASV